MQKMYICIDRALVFHLSLSETKAQPIYNIIIRSSSSLGVILI